MIRKANKFDIPQIFDMLRHYRDAGNIESVSNITNEETPTMIMTYILAGAGIALVSDNEGTLDGMLLAVKTPQLWDNSNYIMNEICYWVEPEHRGSTIGYRLLKSYVELCDDLKDDGHITNYTISQMNGNTLKYDRFGFKRIEEVWSQ